MATALKLQAAKAGEMCVVRLEGRGTMRESPAFQASMLERLECDPECQVVVDLADCDYLDSTFLGCLVVLHKRYGRQQPARFAVAASPDVQAKLLGATGLQRVLHVIESPPVAADAWQTVLLCSADPSEFGRHVMDCHRQLADTDCPQAATFHRIADQMQHDLEKKST